jgi:ankyrin repeat protein
MHGIAGFGKSTLVSSIIQQLQLVLPVKQHLLTCFYFDRAEEGMASVSGLLRALATQLVQKLNFSLDNFLSWFGPDGFAAFESFRQATPDVLENFVMAVAKTRKIIVILDAVDECEDLKVLLALIGRLRARSLDILMSSRLYLVVRKNWDQLIQSDPGRCHELALEPSMNDRDISGYVTQTVESMISSKELSLRDPGLKTEIINTLKSRSDGMFQWVASHLRCLPTYFTDHDISQAMEDLPQGLDKTYEYMLKQLISSTPPRNLRLCRRVFQMLLFARRPLSLPELAVAISIEPGSRDLDGSTILTEPYNILALGGPLIVYKPEINVVQFSHYTVREYFLALGGEAETFHFSKEDAHSEIAHTCLTYIQYAAAMDRLRSMTYSDLRAGQNYDGDLAFLHYASKHWLSHAQQATMSGKDNLTSLLYSFFFAQDGHFRTWQAVVEPSWDAWEKRRQPARLAEAEFQKQTPASAPMLNAMHSLAELLFDRRAASEVNSAPALNDLKRSVPRVHGFLSVSERSIAPLHPFHYLAMVNHPRCLSRALESCGDPILTTGGPLNTTPLHEAAKCGAFEFLSVCLTSEDVAVDAPDILDRTPLFYGSQFGDPRVVQLLLETGAKSKADWYRSGPLHEAVRGGHHAVVKCLLSAPEIDFDAIDMSGDTPLSIACHLNDGEMVSMLVRRSRGRSIVGAVRSCLRWKATSSLKRLVESCSKMTWKPGESPLQEIAREGVDSGPFGPRPTEDRLMILGTFLDFGYAVDLEDSDKDTALTYALVHLQEDIVEYLLGRGAQWSKALRGDSVKRMADTFMGAVTRGRFRIAALLVEWGVPLDILDRSGNEFIDLWAAQVTATEVRSDAPSAESENSAIRLLKGMLRLGMDINAVDREGQSLLHLLCSGMKYDGGGTAELRWVLNHGGDASIRNAESKTALHCLCGNTQVGWTQPLTEVLRLLTHGLQNVNECIPSYGTPIHMLVQSSYGSGMIPQFVDHALPCLLQAGASLSVLNEAGETPLAMALAALIQNPDWSNRNSWELFDAAEKLASPDRRANVLPQKSGDRILERVLEVMEDHFGLASVLCKVNMSPSQTAVALGRVKDAKSIKILVDYGADVNSRDKFGNTPLHLQASTGGDLYDKLEVLLQSGADPTAVTRQGKSVMDLLYNSIAKARASAAGTSDVEQLLLRHGAESLDVKVEASSGGWTNVGGRWMKPGE